LPLQVAVASPLRSGLQAGRKEGVGVGTGSRLPWPDLPAATSQHPCTASAGAQRRRSCAGKARRRAGEARRRPDLRGEGDEGGEAGSERKRRGGGQRSRGREGGRELRAGGGGAGVRDARRLFIRAAIGRGGR